MIPPVPFSFLKIALAIQGFLYFHTYCEIICSSSLKNTVGSLMGIALNLWIALGSILNCTKAFWPQGLFWSEITSPCPPDAASIFQGSAPSPLLTPPLLPAPDSGFPNCSLSSRPVSFPTALHFPQSAMTLFVSLSSLYVSPVECEFHQGPESVSLPPTSSVSRAPDTQ